MSGILQDLRFAFRTMRKSPAFAVIAIATLALGIGGTSIMFAVVDAVLIRPLDYPQAGQVVHLTEAMKRSPGMSIAYANFLDWQQMNHVFSSMGAIRPTSFTLTGSGEAEQLEGREVSQGFLQTLGIPPAIGRDFTPQDDQPSASPTVILSHGLWQRRFSSDPAVVGRAITLDSQAYTVIGVLPKSFSYNNTQPELLVPIGLTKNPAFWQNRFAHAGTYAVARMKPGVTLQQARDDMDRVAEVLQQRYPATNKDDSASVVPMQEWMVGSSRRPLLVLLFAVGLLLLIACGNVANLLLAKASGRQREVAIRAAIGATRARLVSQLLTESVALALMGGAAGALLAMWGTQALVTAAPDSLPRLAEVRMNAPVLAFTFAMAMITGILFGIFPALHSRRASGFQSLRDGSRTGTARGQQRARDLLIAGEIALSLALLLGAGLLVRSFQRVMQVDPGFNTHQLLTATIVLPAQRYRNVDQAEAFYAEAMRNIRQLPGVTAASAVMPLPMSGNEWDTDYILDGMKVEGGQRLPNTEIGFFGPNYVSAMEAPLVAGRAFTEADNSSALPVAIVNQAFAQKNWPNESPLGKRIRMGDPTVLAAPENADSRWHTIIGVIGDVKQYGLDRAVAPTVYRPFAQAGTRPPLRRDLVVRASIKDPLALTEAVRKAVGKADSQQAVADFLTMDQRVAERLGVRQVATVLLGTFAGLALLLAAVGTYGVISYWVVQRTREIGVRVALGASRPQVVKLVVGRATMLLGIGTCAGVAVFITMARFLKSLLFGVSTGDVQVYAAVILLLGLTTILAAYVPARRATKVDPMVALRQE